MNGGGDTLFLSQVEAYKRLSDGFKKRLEGLRAIHSAVPQAEHSRQRGGPVRREPVESEHPVVRVHPVTGEKALYVNQGFTKRIVACMDVRSNDAGDLVVTKGDQYDVRERADAEGAGAGGGDDGDVCGGRGDGSCR